MQKLMSLEGIKHKLDESNHSFKPGTIFIGLPREILDEIDFVYAYKTGKPIIIRHRYIQQYEDIEGVVKQINQLFDGFVVELALIQRAKSFWVNWSVVRVLVSKQGRCGILY